jgi:hypothetical protein
MDRRRASARIPTRHAPCKTIRQETSASTRKGTAMGYSIFYIIGVVVVVALILAWLF